MERIPLPDGQWAELYDGITHGQDKAIKRLVRKAREDEAAWLDVDTAVLAAFLRDWSVKDRDGTAVSGTDVEAIERANSTVVDELTTKAFEIYNERLGGANPDGVSVPNGPTPNSSDSS